MGMLLRRRQETTKLTTSADLNKKNVEKVEEVAKVEPTVKNEKPKTVKRGRPIKK